MLDKLKAFFFQEKIPKKRGHVSRKTPLADHLSWALKSVTYLCAARAVLGPLPGVKAYSARNTTCSILTAEQKTQRIHYQPDFLREGFCYEKPTQNALDRRSTLAMLVQKFPFSDLSVAKIRYLFSKDASRLIARLSPYAAYPSYRFLRGFRNIAGRYQAHAVVQQQPWLPHANICLKMFYHFLFYQSIQTGMSYLLDVQEDSYYTLLKIKNAYYTLKQSEQHGSFFSEEVKKSIEEIDEAISGYLRDEKAERALLLMKKREEILVSFPMQIRSIDDTAFCLAILSYKINHLMDNYACLAGLTDVLSEIQRPVSKSLPRRQFYLSGDNSLLQKRFMQDLTATFNVPLYLVNLAEKDAIASLLQSDELPLYRLWRDPAISSQHLLSTFSWAMLATGYQNPFVVLDSSAIDDLQLLKTLNNFFRHRSSSLGSQATGNAWRCQETLSFDTSQVNVFLAANSRRLQPWLYEDFLVLHFPSETF